MKTILLTGAAGFIGAKTAERLLSEGYRVVGVDNLNGYYDLRLKKYRLERLAKSKNFKFIRADVCHEITLRRIFKKYKPDAVMNLAAMAGVRTSLEKPVPYLMTNGVGALILLECCRQFGVQKIIFASTSSLYAGEPVPFRETLAVNQPISPYAASKKTAEVFGWTYHHLYGLHVTVLRYFTVYGPAGRPDMSPFKFVKQIAEGGTITIYGDGSQRRDFTYIDDIARGTVEALKLTGFHIINLGGNKPYRLDHFVGLIEKYLGKKARIRYKPWQKADMRDTWAEIQSARKFLDWKPETNLEEGLRQTVLWHKKNAMLVRKISVDF